ncbi:hypothetical protein [Ferrimicrobium sp.]|uniref:uridine kinase family protein n=1 Tax=Ferrimicrobium sp. TaxID=2926050 RepID=UPI002605FB10|nr:hypothetical protein [Ferrimicrobium sp.]
MNNSHPRWEPSLDEILVPIRGLPGASAIIGISGYGGSGKTTLAHTLAERLSAPIISIDEFGTSGVFLRSDDWQGFDRERLVRQVLAPLARGVRELSYDSCNDWETWETVPTHLVMERFLLLEGVGLFHPDVVPYLDYRIWLDVPLAEATARGIARERILGRDQGDVWQRLWGPNESDFERKFQPKESAHRLVCSERSVP